MVIISVIVAVLLVVMVVLTYKAIKLLRQISYTVHSLEPEMYRQYTDLSTQITEVRNLINTDSPLSTNWEDVHSED